MAKKNVVQSPAERAESLTKRLVELRQKESEIGAEITEVEAELLAWANENGQKDLFGQFTVVERQLPAKLVGATGKMLEMSVEKLLVEVDAAFVKTDRKLDLGRIAAALPTNAGLAALLKEKGLRVEQSTSTSLRAAK